MNPLQFIIQLKRPYAELITHQWERVVTWTRGDVRIRALISRNVTEADKWKYVVFIYKTRVNVQEQEEFEPFLRLLQYELDEHFS